MVSAASAESADSVFLWLSGAAVNSGAAGTSAGPACTDVGAFSVCRWASAGAAATVGMALARVASGVVETGVASDAAVERISVCLPACTPAAVANADGALAASGAGASGVTGGAITGGAGGVTGAVDVGGTTGVDAAGGVTGA